MFIPFQNSHWNSDDFHKILLVQRFLLKFKVTATIYSTVQRLTVLASYRRSKHVILDHKNNTKKSHEIFTHAINLQRSVLWYCWQPPAKIPGAYVKWLPVHSLHLTSLSISEMEKLLFLWLNDWNSKYCDLKFPRCKHFKNLEAF